MLLRESMGIAADGSNKAFPSQDVDNFLDRPRMRVPVDIMEELSRYNTRHFVLAVDPSGGGGSAFAVSSMVQIPTGQIIVSLSPLPRDNFLSARPPTTLTTRMPARQTNPVLGTSCECTAGG